MHRRMFLSTLLTGAAYTATAAERPVVETTTGKIRGLLDGGIHVFKGVRYGADTTTRRFLPPIPPQAWTGVRDTVDFGPNAPQPSSSGLIGEDCLHLNIWAPRDGG